MSFMKNIMSRVGFIRDIKDDPDGECNRSSDLGAIDDEISVSKGYGLFASKIPVLAPGARGAAYLKVACVASGIDLIVRNMQMIKPVFFDEKKNNYIEHGENDYLRGVRRLFQRPNPTDTLSTLIEKSVKNYEVYGAIYYAFFLEDNKKPLSIKLLDFDCVLPTPDLANNRISYYTVVNAGVYSGQYDFDGKYYVNRENPRLVLAPLINAAPDAQYYPASPLEGAGVETLLYWYGCYHNKSLLENGARPSLIFLIKSLLSPKHREELRHELYRRFSGSANTGRTMIIDGSSDKEVKELSQNNKDMEFVSVLQAAEEAIYKRLGVNWVLSKNITSKDLPSLLELFYDMTVCPLFKLFFNHLFDVYKYYTASYNGISVAYLERDIPALRGRFMERMANMPTLGIFTIGERRAMYGFAPLGDERDNELTVETIKVSQQGENNAIDTGFESTS